MHCCCRCCCPAAPGPDRRRLLPCRLWATALWTSQCLPPAVWDLWCPHRWRCMFAPKAPTGCFCCPAASRRRRTKIRRGRGRVRTRSRIISQVAGICKSLPKPSERVPCLWFFFFGSSHFRIFRAAASDKAACGKGNQRRATTVAAVCHFRGLLLLFTLFPKHFLNWSPNPRRPARRV